MRHVVVPGARLHVERTGRGEPLLWITGFGIGAQIFAPVLPLYAEAFDCVSYDNRGAGRSSVPLRPTSMPELAADAVRVLDALEIESAHVHGISMGGMIAQEMALRFPDRVRGLVLQGTSPGGPRSAVPQVEGLGALALQRLPLARDRKIRLLVRALFSDEYARAHPDEVLGHLERLGADRAGARGALLHVLASSYHDAVSRLPGLQAPTLVLHGSLDKLVPVGNAKLLARRIPGGELALVQGAGHIPMLEQPEHVRELIGRFLLAGIAAGRPLSGLAAATEPLTRAAGLQVGAARIWRSAWSAAGRALTPR
ncbi:MAG: alpha/beta fold hydrolase [Frankiales bacterium]|nr:alpha/beta fold hydrolase [Frankiales bacterium]